MGDIDTEALIDAMLDGGFHGSPQDFADGLADEDIAVDVELVQKVLVCLELTGGARRSPRGMWYRAGKLVKKAEGHNARSGRQIGSLERRLIFAPSLCPDSIVLLTVRDGTRGFRVRSYSLAATKPRFLSVPDANNDIGELERLLGPFTPDVWWDDPGVRGVDDVSYWYPIIRDLNKKHLGH